MDSTEAIKVLDTKADGFHDLMNNEKHIYKYINGKYFFINSPAGAIKDILSTMGYKSKNRNSCYFGLTNDIKSMDMTRILKANYTKSKEHPLSFEALNSQYEANIVKKNLLSKGIAFYE